MSTSKKSEYCDLTHKITKRIMEDFFKIIYIHLIPKWFCVVNFKLKQIQKQGNVVLSRST